jgi:hypothetical protein
VLALEASTRVADWTLDHYFQREGSDDRGSDDRGSDDRD